MNDALIKNYEAIFKETVAVIHAPFEETPDLDYNSPHTVAFVEVPKHLSDEEKCEIAFKKTNTIEEVWWKNEGISINLRQFPACTGRRYRKVMSKVGHREIGITSG